MTTTTTRRCEGKRRMWRGNKLGLFKCGRKATLIATSSVGYSKTHYLCDDAECWGEVSCGYPMSSRELQK